MKTKQFERQLSVTVDDRTLKLLNQLSTKTMFNKSLIVRMLNRPLVGLPSSNENQLGLLLITKSKRVYSHLKNEMGLRLFGREGGVRQSDIS